MCKLCTALLALSAAGLTIGGGLTMNPLVSGAVSGFAAGGIRGAVTGAFSAGVGAVAGQVIKEVPGFLSGVASDALRSTAGSLLNSTEFNNITATIQSQGSSFFSNFDPTGGIAQKASEVFQSINAYATNAFTVAGSLSQLGDLKISEELGFNLTNPADLATGGLVREFGTLAGQAWTDITSGIQRFGTLFDPSNLGKAFNPLNVADNLIRQGFGEEILGALDSKGISYEQLMTGAVDPRAVTAALDAMPGNHLRQILESTGVVDKTDNLNTIVETQLCSTNKSKKVYGVSLNGNTNGVVSLGEATMLVTNFGGDIMNGDYICSSEISGYGMLQDDDILHSYTVAKSTEDIDWNNVTDTIEHNGQTYKKVLVAVTLHCG